MTPDIIVIGSGISGAAFAAAAAGAGLEVLVLERDVRRRDRALGEYLQPWGVAEALRLDLVDTLMAAGATVGQKFARYHPGQDPSQAEADALDLTALVPGVPGSLTVGHPQACSALTEAALARGASIVTGVRDVQVSPGSSPEVSWTRNGVPGHARCRLVVGADGRRSSVRAQAGGLVRATSPHLICDVALFSTRGPGWPAGLCATVNGRDTYTMIFGRGSRLVRVYTFSAPSRQHEGPAGRRARPFAGLAVEGFPRSAAIAEGALLGPVVRYRMNSAITEAHPTPGVVLIGDAAGWSNPLIGQGLSVALRDARLLAEAVASNEHWDAPAFTPYVRERRELLRRLRVAAFFAGRVQCTFGDAGTRLSRRYAEVVGDDPESATLTRSYVTGPELAPAQVFSIAHVQRLLGILRLDRLPIPRQDQELAPE